MATINIVLQIDASQHHSEERFCVRYTDAGGNEAIEIVNVSGLVGAEATKYTDFKAMAESKIPA